MKPLHPTESAVPGGIHLCQVREGLSCGACCGLYNVADASRSALHRLLQIRTKAFEAIERTVDSLTAFAEAELYKLEPGPYPEFHHCPYVGLIGERKQHVGCLLHPAGGGNNGTDYRGLSYYGGMACRMYFCPSHEQLAPLAKKIICHAAPDWYTYGLWITETELLQAFLAQIETRLGYAPAADQLVHRPQAMQGVHAFLALKFRWPYRTSTQQHPCNYFFKDRRCHPSDVADAGAGAEPSRFDGIFHPLGSTFNDARQLAEAEDMLDTIFDFIIADIR